MPTILDFFKPVGAGKPRRDGNPIDVTHEASSSEIPTRPRSPRDTKSKLRNTQKPKRKASKPPTTRNARKRRARNELESEIPIPDDAEPDRKHEVTEKTEADEAEEAASPEQEPVGSDGLSEYERKRLAKMAANAKFLQELGMGHAQLEMTRQLQTQEAKQVKKPAKAKKPKVNLEPVRRSRRVRGQAALFLESETSSIVVDEDDESDGADEEVSFDDSSVFHYTFNDNNTIGKVLESATASLDDSAKMLMGFSFDEQAFVTDPTLKSVYGVSFSPFQEHGLIATGGHGGRVSIYAMPSVASSAQAEREKGDNVLPHAHKPLMSFKAHTGWVSSVSLSRSICGKKNLLLTAANDGVLKLWDLNRTSSVLRTPKELIASTTQHSKGIFGMDVCGDTIVTCSKDGSIALSQIRDNTDTIDVVRRIEDHKGIVKSVHFATGDPQRFASGGNDRVLRVFDLRLPDARAATLEVYDSHARVINSVRFHPTDDHLLLSAGFDPYFYMFDLRKALIPVCTFMRSSVSGSSSSIFHPIFVNNGREVAAACGNQLALYKTSDGTTISRGEVDGKISYIAADPFQDRIAVAGGDTLQFAGYRWGGAE